MSSNQITGLPLGIFMVVVVISLVITYYTGRSSYLYRLKKKHFSEWGYDKKMVAERLVRIASNLDDQYRRRDAAFKMDRWVAAGSVEAVRDLIDLHQRISKEIERLWDVRHEAEATAKLMGFGQLVDQIHEKGIRKSESKPVEV